jgi:hypothetical protein
MATESSEGYVVFPDLHGQYELAARALERYDLGTVTPVFAGDFIDIGPDSAKLVTLIRKAQAEGAVALTGNHEWVCRNVLSPEENPLVAEWRDLIWPGYESGLLESYGLERTGNRQHDAEQLSERMTAAGDLEFLRDELLPSFETDDFVVVHAGPVPDQPWAAQREALEWAAGPAERLGEEPRQIFDHALAMPAAIPESVDRRCFVTGHAHLSESASERRVGNRICLASRLEAGQPLYVWESRPGRIVEISQS